MTLEITINATGSRRCYDVDPSLMAARFSDVEKEIIAGLPCESERITAGQANAAYWRRENANFIERRPEETLDEFARRPKRPIFMTRHAVDSLARKLFSPAPSRTFRPEGPAAEVLKAAYAKGKGDLALAEANRWAILNDVSAIQVSCTGNPADPVRFYVYPGHEFAAYCTADEPTLPWCVVTIGVESAGRGQKRRVYTAWTADMMRVYKTRPYTVSMDTAGGVVASLVSSESNPYGVVPFAYLPNETSVDRFWGSGIGDALRTVNAEVDRESSDLAQQIQVFSCPDMFARGVSSKWAYQKIVGKPQILTNAQEVKSGDISGLAAVAEVFYVQPTLAVEETWLDIERTMNRCFADLDVPLASVRDGVGAPTSGLQVMAESIPLLDYLADRKLAVAPVDLSLAQTVLRCVGGYHKRPDITAAAEALEEDIIWPEAKLPVPTPEADNEDQFELNTGLASPIQVIMRRRGMTREQAILNAKQIAVDNKIWTGYFPADPAKAEDPAAPPPVEATEPTPPEGHLDLGAQDEQDTEPI